MNLLKLIKGMLFILALVCFYIVYLMYTKLSFIDKPYLYGGLILTLIAILIRKSK